MEIKPAQSGAAIRCDVATHFEKERGITEVTVLPGVAHATVTLSDAPGGVAHGRLELLQKLAARGVPVFLVKLLPDGLSFALRAAQVEAGAGLLAEEGLPHRLRRDLALMTVVAGAMRDLSGVMSSIYEALVSRQIAVRQTGDAHNAVHLLVPGDRASEARQALHECFALPTPADTGAGDAPEGVGLGTL